MSNKLFLARYGDHEHINKALNDEDTEVRREAIKNPNATHEHINKALDDEHWNVRASAISHNNATHEHINKALNDEDRSVRKLLKID